MEHENLEFCYFQNTFRNWKYTIRLKTCYCVSHFIPNMFDLMLVGGTWQVMFLETFTSVTYESDIN